MGRVILLLQFFLLGAFLLACAPRSAPVEKISPPQSSIQYQPPGMAEWEKIQVSDPRVWWRGQLPYIDREHTIFSFVASPAGEGTFAINTEITRAEEIKSYYDF